jgi:hypothetical protein
MVIRLIQITLEMMSQKYNKSIDHLEKEYYEEKYHETLKNLIAKIKEYSE